MGCMSKVNLKATLVFVVCTMHKAGLGGDRLWKYSGESVNLGAGNSSGIAATSRMHLSCSLVTASAVQRVLDSTCFALLHVAKAWSKSHWCEN